MTNVFSRAVMFLLVTAIAYFLKKRKIFQQSDYKILSKIILNVTLPAAAVVYFSEAEWDNAVLFIAVIGIGCNLLSFLSAWLITRIKHTKDPLLYMMNVPGYNVGSCMLPFLQSFLPASGIITACMFDAGNAVMVAGGTYALASIAAQKERQHSSFRLILKSLFSNATFPAYMLMCLIRIMNWRLPSPVIEFGRFMGGANIFISMFMTGLMLEIPRNKKETLQTAALLAMRYSISFILAGCIYWLLPIDMLFRKVLVIVLFSPISILAPVYTGKLNSNAPIAGMANSLSIPISLMIATFFMSCFF